jgi:phosphatidylglycerol---prolipoprotein diacylglyceryl transferase
MDILAYITWDFSPDILPGVLGSTPFHPRWYGLLFALAFILGYQILLWVFKIEKRNLKDLELLTITMIIGTVVGARLGHCLFYDPGFYLTHPLKIFYVWEGGLASHGAAIGILLSLWWFVKKRPQINFLWIADRIAIVVALAASFVRLGNFLNSEIIGTPSDMPWAVLFVRSTEYSLVPRHPVQLYESICYILIFIYFFFSYRSKKSSIPSGLFCGQFLVIVFSIRFILEFFKEEQAAFITQFPVTMGQMLSIPFIIIGIYFIFKSLKTKPS